ncbi:N-acetylmuramoyl-L-alanine amidase [Flavihumibacter petaseus]|uniref:N-acetylmuramoyl-L-alanine amidase n=1 Tax=Flavihumibacter petaseus NBRC 106054 TaxID=1220578 RepID=A0A0E9N5H4_9BACT|nr:N-acetylmuramoyl-L-alanine amidase [Flavihumibacter petaseus]GAO44595.1 peptidase M56 family protein [Flavihumibacter petaseus NBRC 106054]
MTVIPMLYKMILGSGIFLGYYWLFLRNRRHHQFNRFFLLAAVLVSLALPFVHIEIPVAVRAPMRVWVPGELPVTVGEWQEAELSPGGVPVSAFRWDMVWPLIYFGGLVLGMWRFGRSAIRLEKTRQLAVRREFNGQQLMLTNDPVAPCTFLNNLFWPMELEPASEEGQLILRHERYHLQQRHGIDILLMELVCTFAWFNPFVHLINKELKTVHEFAADAAATPADEALRYAELLLEQQISRKQHLLILPFSHPPLKRRILMLIQTSKKHNTLFRWLALPVAAIIFCALAFRPGRTVIQPTDQVHARLGYYANPFLFGQEFSSPVKSRTIVIDAGHGGIDPGAMEAGISEKDLNLSLAKDIARLASEYKVDIELTRTSDALPGSDDPKESLRYRMKMYQDAALFVALHVGAGSAVAKGEVIIPPDSLGKDIVSASRRSGSMIAKALEPHISMNQQLKQVRRSVYVLNQTKVPAVLIECGNMSLTADREALNDPVRREAIARAILTALQQYLESGC